ncbi:SDR family oxidoreductase [Variovorax sp. NFACC27]|uniref:SDR family oxidoreductase n=1 Tax=unclassified Variovorax TaxID=663243 RepID=UPI00089ACE1C|nr:3-oxoacyl-[acyl-carrier protein] reductase [Variovorax sp. NFACC28]SEG11542.1 3-oxoacyl-[acyl-carrier protein] reductase [Variovorax sp. NFACC29]SFC05568.1 3-oxoacyl-[acyl-carrier protein] reductase [Variovorax sp. NFACC26]SFH07756.1 3-oxoacyl-[acyl-carrier protein] reductase [Variovorax sp. NFACC27]
MTTTHLAPQPALAGKAAFVTGGSRGIGAAIVRRLARDGAAVAFTFVSAQAKADALAGEIRAAGGRALALRADAGDAATLTAAVEQAAQAFGRLDILVNNAGVYLRGELDSFTLEDFDRTVGVNVRAVFVAAKAAARRMGEGGRIVNIGSINAERVPAAGASVYAMSKAAIVGLTRGLARDLGPRGITVNNVQPGPTDTEMNPAAGPRAGFMHGLMALPRHGRADEIAGMVAYLAGPEGGFVTGASLSVDGGYTA